MQQYFLPMKAVEVAGGQRFVGQFIVDGQVTVASGGSKASPRIGQLQPFEVKWIVGPGGLGRAEAEAAGYETVDWDDFSYPPPRG